MKGKSTLEQAGNMWGQSNNKIYDDGPTLGDGGDVGTGESQAPGFLGRLQFWKGKNNTPSSLGQRINAFQTRAEDYKLGLAIMGAGGFFLLLSLVFLPTVVLMPSKFCGLFDIGSVILMLGVSVMMGNNQFRASLVSADLRLYTCMYVVSLLSNIYFSCISRSYLLSIITILCETVSLSYLVMSNVPYGKQILDMIYGTTFSAIRWMISQCAKKSDKPFLPI